MYTILVNHQDGNGDQIIWDGSSAYQILDPNHQEELDQAPTFDFTILPNHPQYNKIVKFKSCITVKRNNTILFYGRVLGDGTDIYGQKKIACEGALSFLLDSVQSVLKKTKETPKASLTRLINSHNSQMPSETYKQFTVGTVNVKDAEVAKDFTISSYDTTRNVLEGSLVDEYGGYLRTRFESGRLYIDWLKEYGRINPQPIKMAVNLLEKNTEELADDYYTVMLPTGKNNRTIASANDGSIYIKDDAAVQKYGTIIHTESFDASSADKLLEKANRKFKKRGSEIPLSVTVKAIDMILLGQQTDEILLGDVLTGVEGYERLTVSEINRNLFNPENDEYTLENDAAISKRHDTEGRKGTLSSRSGGYGGSLANLLKYYKELDNLATITVEELRIATNRLRISSGELTEESEEFQDFTDEEKNNYRTYFRGVRHQIPKEVADTVMEISGIPLDDDNNVIYATDKDGNPITYNGAKVPKYIDEKAGVFAKSMSAQSIRNANSLVDIVGEIGIQINKATGLPVVDNHGNFINVELNDEGYIKYDKDGNWTVIDFPDGTIRSRLTRAENEITAEVRDRKAADVDYTSRMQVKIDDVEARASMVVTGNSKDGFEVSRASVVAAINKGTGESYVKIEADQVDLGDYATVGTLEGLQAQFNQLITGQLDASSLSVSGTVAAGTVAAGYVQGSQLWLLDGDGDRETRITGNGVTGFGTAYEEGNQIKIPYYTFEIPKGSQIPAGTINFNIADTQTYEDGVSAALRNVTMTDAGWRYFDDQDHQGYYSMVSNSANSNKVYVGLPTITLEASANWSSSHKKTVYAYGPGKYGTVATSLVIDASDIYQEGGIASSALSDSSNSTSDYSTWTEDADKTLVLSKKYGLVTVSPNSGSNYDIVIDAARTYNAGWDALVSNASSSNYISLGSASSATGDITKTTTGVSGYVWAKKSSGSWEKRRTFSISHTTGAAYHKVTVCSSSISVKVYLGNGYKTITSSPVADERWDRY